MSVTFAQRGRPPPNTAQIQNMLNENSQLLQTISEYQSKGKAQECVQYQQILHRNLVYLASIADSSQNIQQLLPPPQNHQGVVAPPVQHGVPHNTNASPSQPPVPPTSEMPPAQAPPTNNFSPPSNMYRGPPQTVNSQRPQTSAGPQQYRPNSVGYPQQGPHQSFANNQFAGPAPGHMPPQPNYNTSAQQPPHGGQTGAYPPAAGSYPPSQAPVPFSQPTSNGYGPSATVPPVAANYGPPGQSQIGYQNGPGSYPPPPPPPQASQQPNYGPNYGQTQYGSGGGSQSMAQSSQTSAYPVSGGYPNANYANQQSNYPPISCAGPPAAVVAAAAAAAAANTPPTSYASQTSTSPSASTQTYPSNNAPNYPPVFQPNQNGPPPPPPPSSYQPNPGSQGPAQTSYGPAPPAPNHSPLPQSYPPSGQVQPPQGYPPQNYPPQGYVPQSYSSVPGQHNQHNVTY